MKKIIALVLVIMIMMSMSLIPVSAAGNEVLKGTPTMDGKLDDIYKSSFSITVDTSSVVWVPVASPDEIVANVYFLHDGTNLYVAAQITGDSAVVDTGLTSWVADSVEVWFNDQAQHYSKLPMPAFETTLPGGALHENDNQLGIDWSKVSMAATQYDDGYIVEVKLPIPYYSSDKNSIGINVQLNNAYDANPSLFDKTFGGAYGTQPPATPVVVALSDKVADGDSSAKTGDASTIVAVAVAAVFSAGAIGFLASKKKEF